MKLCVDKQAVPELVRVDATTATVQWSPVEVSVQTVEEVSDSNFVTSYLLQMQHVDVPSPDYGKGVGAGEGRGDDGRAGDAVEEEALMSLVSEDAWCMQYWGSATHVQVKGLLPGRYYALCVQCHPSVKNGAADVELLPPSDTLLFRTKPAVPSPMLPPILLVKNQTSLKLYLAEPEEQGGYPVTEYIVEGTVPNKGMNDFESIANAHGMCEIYRGPDRSFVWEGLAPGSRYSVRAKAVNQIGEGAFSSTASFLTQSAPPDAPSGILCMPTPPDMLTLRWDKPGSNGADIVAYTVELDDGSGHFRVIARVQVCSLVLAKLVQGQAYKIRISAENSEGRSDWSPVVVHEIGFSVAQGDGRITANSGNRHANGVKSRDSSLATNTAERPGTPRNLRHDRLKNSSVFSWEPQGPSLADQKFILEIAEVDRNKSAAHIWKVRYKSDTPRHEIHTLKSDLKYQVAVKSTTSAGDSSYCKTILVDMKELTGKVQAPKTPTRFSYVDEAGGAKLAWHLEPLDAVDCIFELYVAVTDDLSHKKNYVRKNAFTLLYRGDAMLHKLGDELTVGKHYTARVRAMRNGKTSDWSPDICFDHKDAKWFAKVPWVKVHGVHATSFSLTWAPVPDDETQLSTSSAKDSISYAISLEETNVHNTGPKVIQTGLRHSQTTVEDLQPDSEYHVRVRAHCGGAHGPWSEPVTIATEPDLLSAPELYVESKSQDAICLAWSLPADRKGRCLVSRVELQETKLGHFEKLDPRKFHLGACSSFVASGLCVGSLYGFRIRLGNEDDIGPWSRLLQVETEPGPPDKPYAPTTSPTGVGNVFKVNWRHPLDNGSTITDFELSLAPSTDLAIQPDQPGQPSQSRKSRQADMQYRVVYQGPDLTARVQNLEFGAKYYVRVRASNSCGHGAWSDPAEIQTLAKPPEPPEDILAEIRGNQVHISWTQLHDVKTPRAGYDIEVKGPSSHKHRSERKSVVVARKTCNATMTSCTIPQPTCAGELHIRVRSIGSHGSGHGPWSSPCTIVSEGILEECGPLSRTTSPTTRQLSSLTSRRSSDKESQDPGSPNSSTNSGSKKYKRRAFQKTATARQPKARFTLANFCSGARFSRFDIFAFFFLCMMFLALYQTSMDIGFFGKPMRTSTSADFRRSFFSLCITLRTLQRRCIVAV